MIIEIARKQFRKKFGKTYFTMDVHRIFPKGGKAWRQINTYKFFNRVNLSLIVCEKSCYLIQKSNLSANNVTRTIDKPMTYKKKVS